MLRGSPKSGFRRTANSKRLFHWLKAGSARGLGKVGVEVAPGGVGLFDEAEFPGAVPVFEAFFALDGFGHGGMGFVPDESADLVFPGEGGAAVVLVARDSLPQVGGDADVQGAVALAGEDVDGWGFGGLGRGHGGW